jgi:hypothetical protein
MSASSSSMPRRCRPRLPPPFRSARWESLPASASRKRDRWARGCHHSWDLSGTRAISSSRSRQDRLRQCACVYREQDLRSASPANASSTEASGTPTPGSESPRCVFRASVSRPSRPSSSPVPSHTWHPERPRCSTCTSCSRPPVSSSGKRRLLAVTREVMQLCSCSVAILQQRTLNVVSTYQPKLLLPLQTDTTRGQSSAVLGYQARKVEPGGCFCGAHALYTIVVSDPG